MKTYVVGHKNPDTDSVVSAVAVADLWNFEAAVAGELNKETKLVLDKFNTGMPQLIPAEEKEVYLVDHNEISQISENVKTSEIKAIYDHHKLGGLTTDLPIMLWFEPFGSTSTIISDAYEMENKQPNKSIASLLIAGIISDTLNFTSPTTTVRDKKAAEKLNKIAELDIDKLAAEMFAAKSDISDVDTEELLGKDYKVFNINGKKVGYGVWETVLPDKVLERKKEIMEVLSKKKLVEGLDCIYFGVVDILDNKSDVCIVSEEEGKIAEKAYGGKVIEGLMSLDGVVSRKKQMIPPLEKYFSTN